MAATGTVAVIGLGYVGLPLAVEAGKSGHKVIGFDNDTNKIKILNSGHSLVEDIKDNTLRKLIEDKYLILTNDPAVFRDASIIIVCVPTPLNSERKPDLSYLLDALTTAGKNLTKNTLVIIESTVAPGTTREILLPHLEKISGISRNDFLIAFSPERVDPLNSKWNISNTPKLVAGFSDTALKNAHDFYSTFIQNLVLCDSLEIAETAKLLENTFRLINISFINEFSKICYKLGIDVGKVINAASTKPYGFMPFFPGIGIGGHCIPVDPIYMSSKAKEVGASTFFIDLADRVNQEMPSFFVQRADEKLNGLTGKKILVLGIAYKPDVSDVRETPVVSLISELRSLGAKVFWHDDLVNSWNGETSTPLSKDFDLAIIATRHKYMDLTVLGDTQIIDTRSSI
jgi:UDP-N-acetyl-D-glucosamine dehydrogenase